MTSSKTGLNEVMSQFHLQIYFLKIHLLGLTSGRLSTNIFHILYAFLLFLLRPTCPAHRNLLDFSSLIVLVAID